MPGQAESWKVGLVRIQPGRPMQNGARQEFPRKAARRVPKHKLVQKIERHNVESKERSPHPHRLDYDGREIISQ
jgi:hypothetical protein